MLHICIYAVRQLFLILSSDLVLSLTGLLVTGAIIFAVTKRIFEFPQVPSASLNHQQAQPSPRRQLEPPSLSVPKPRWGKAFSYTSQDVASSSSDSDSTDAHDLLARCWNRCEENGTVHEDGEKSQRRKSSDLRDLRREKWRRRHFTRATIETAASHPVCDRDDPYDLLRARNVNGSVSERPRLQRQEPVLEGSQSNLVNHWPERNGFSKRPIDVEAIELLEPEDEEIATDKKEPSPVLSDRAVPSELSVSVAEEPSSDALYPAEALINPEPGPVCGSVEVSFFYEAMERTLFVTVIQAGNLDSVAHAGLQIKLCLMPSKRLRFKTKVRHGKAPKFHECFHLKGIAPDDINDLGLRFRLYMYPKLVRGQLIGECVVGFGSINLEVDTTLWLTLEPKKAVLFHTSQSGSDIRSMSRSDSTLSAHSMPLSSSCPELLVGLSFNDITGHLKVEIAKGSRFRSPGLNRPVDTFVKLTLLSPNAQEISRAKTSVRRAQPNPVFRESFLFPVALFQLADVTLVCTVYIRRSMKRKQLLGWMAMGHNNSSREGTAHWRDFQESRDQTWRWHALITR